MNEKDGAKAAEAFEKSRDLLRDSPNFFSRGCCESIALPPWQCIKAVISSAFGAVSNCLSAPSIFEGFPFNF